MSDDQPDLLGESSFTPELLEHLDDIPEEVSKKWPKDLVALLAIYGAALKRQGLDEDLSRKISHALLAEQANYCGGRYFYLPRLDALKRAIRDVELYKDHVHKQMLPDELSTKYNLTVPHVYRVIKEQQAYYIKSIQHDMF